MAYLIDDSFTKEEVEKDGFMWRDEKIKVDIPEGAEIVYASEKVNKLCHPELVSGSLKGRSPNYDSEINSE
jgi:hypothetical protein